MHRYRVTRHAYGGRGGAPLTYSSPTLNLMMVQKTGLLQEVYSRQAGKAASKECSDIGENFGTHFIDDIIIWWHSVWKERLIKEISWN